MFWRKKAFSGGTFGPMVTGDFELFLAMEERSRKRGSGEVFAILTRRRRQVAFDVEPWMNVFYFESPDMIRGCQFNVGYVSSYEFGRGVTGSDGLTALQNFMIACRLGQGGTYDYTE